MKQVQIPQELFVLLIHYHLMEDDSNVDEIRIGLEKKLDAMVLHELYEKSKTAPTEAERKNSGRNIWIGREYLTAFAGNGFFDDMRQERVTLL